MDGAQVSDNIVNQVMKKLYFPSRLLERLLCYQIFRFVTIFRVPSGVYSSGVSLPVALSQHSATAHASRQRTPSPARRALLPPSLLASLQHKALPPFPSLSGF